MFSNSKKSNSVFYYSIRFVNKTILIFINQIFFVIKFQKVLYNY